MFGAVKRSASGQVYMIEIDENHYVEAFFVLEDEECDEKYISFKACGIRGFLPPNIERIRKKDRVWENAPYMSEEAAKKIIKLIEEVA